VVRPIFEDSSFDVGEDLLYLLFGRVENRRPSIFGPAVAVWT